MDTSGPQARPPLSSVSCPSPPGPHALLSKDITPPAKNSSSISLKDWQELCERMRTMLGATLSSWKYFSSEERLWQSARQMQLILKKPMSTGKLTLIRGLLTGTRKRVCQKGIRKMKDISQTSLFQSLTATTPSMSPPHTSNSTAGTVWGLWGSANLFTNIKFSPLMHYHQQR